MVAVQMMSAARTAASRSVASRGPGGAGGRFGPGGAAVPEGEARPRERRCDRPRPSTAPRCPRRRSGCCGCRAGQAGGRTSRLSPAVFHLVTRWKSTTASSSPVVSANRVTAPLTVGLPAAALPGKIVADLDQLPQPVDPGRAVQQRVRAAVQEAYRRSRRAAGRGPRSCACTRPSQVRSASASGPMISMLTVLPPVPSAAPPPPAAAPSPRGPSKRWVCQPRARGRLRRSRPCRR